MMRRLTFIAFLCCLTASAWAQESDEVRTSIRISAEIITGLSTTSTPQQTQRTQDSAQATTAEVASTLMQAANAGTISISDTAMVAALATERVPGDQNLDALITVTVVDAEGNVTNKSMRQVDMPADVLGFPVEVAERIQRQGAVARGGETLRRTPGITYFYVQVCSCSL